MNLACIKRQNKGVGKMVMGLTYVKCEQIYTMMEMNVKRIEENIQNYLLLLPPIFEENFVQEYAVIFHDWDVGDINHEKKLSNLCCYCFEKEVL